MVEKRYWRILIVAVLIVECALIWEVKGINSDENYLSGADIEQDSKIKGRSLQQQAQLVKVEDISQKYTSQLQERELVVIRQKPLSRKFTDTDKGELWVAAILAEDINGKVIYQNRHLNTSNEKDNTFGDDSESENTCKQLRSLSTTLVNGMNADLIRAQEMIKKEKEYYEMRIRLLKDKAEYSQQLIAKYSNKNGALQNQLGPNSTANSSAQAQATPPQPKYDGFPIPESDLPPLPKNNTIAHLPFCIVVPSFNNAKNMLYKRNINSILQQDYSNYHVVYVDDQSQDDTMNNVLNYLKELFDSSYEEIKAGFMLQNSEILSLLTGKATIREFNINGTKWTFVQNHQRKYALHNIYQAIHKYCQNNQIALILDGDDALIGTQTLFLLNEYYKITHSLFIYSNYLYKKHIQLKESLILPQQWSQVQKTIKVNDQIINLYQHDWIDKKTSYKATHVTTYEKGPAGIEMPQKAIHQQKFRQIQTLLASHLLTFYVSLFKKIDQSNFVDENNQFFQYAYDRALTLPLAELVPGNSWFINNLLYEYNADTGINDSPESWGNVSLKIRQKPSLPALNPDERQQMLNQVLKS